MHDLDKANKDFEKQNTIMKRQIMEKDGLITELRQELGEISTKFKSLSSKLNIKEDEFRNLQQDYNLELGELTDEKQKLEEKMSQLIDIVKQQSKELTDNNTEFQIVDKERKQFKKTNHKYKLELEELSSTLAEMKNEINILSDTRVMLVEKERINVDLESRLENEVFRSQNYQKVNNELSEKLTHYKIKYSGENSLENLTSLIQVQKDEIENLK